MGYKDRHGNVLIFQNTFRKLRYLRYGQTKMLYGLSKGHSPIEINHMSGNRVVIDNLGNEDI